MFHILSRNGLIAFVPGFQRPDSPNRLPAPSTLTARNVRYRVPPGTSLEMSPRRPNTGIKARKREAVGRNVRATSVRDKHKTVGRNQEGRPEERGRTRSNRHRRHGRWDLRAEACTGKGSTEFACSDENDPPGEPGEIDRETH